MSGPDMAKKAREQHANPTLNLKPVRRRLIGGMRTIGKYEPTLGQVTGVVGRAVKAAGTSLLKDYQGSSLQKKFEGTPITVETKFETTPSPPVKRPRTSTGKKATVKRGTIKYPDEGTANTDNRSLKYPRKYWVAPR